MYTSESILAIDTTAGFCRVGISDGLGGFVGHSHRGEYGHSACLIPMIQELLSQSGMSRWDLSAIAVLRGPGGFTGIRVGLAAARGLGLALGIAVVGLANLTLWRQHFSLRHNLASDSVVAVLLESKRKDFYSQVSRYDGSEFSDILPPACRYASELADCLAQYQGGYIIGDAESRFQAEIPYPLPQFSNLQLDLPSLPLICSSARAILQDGTAKSHSATPIYLKQAPHKT